MNPKILEIQLTPACNMQCIYCGNSPDLLHGESLSTALALKAIEELNPETILFTGGEVYYAWDVLLEILDTVKHRGFNYILSSNLSLISTDELALLIDTYGFRTFHSSFNDLTEHMTGNIRKVNLKARARIIENIKYLASRGVTLKIETMLISPNTDHLTEINTLLYQLGVKYHKLEYLIPVGHANEALLLPPEVITEKILDFYHRKQNDTVIELTCFCLSPCMGFAEQLFAIDAPDFVFNKCIDGRETCYLLANGTLVPCFLFPENESPINVKTHDLLDAWENHEIFAGFRQGNDDCNQCDHYQHNPNSSHPVCNNGCATLNYIKSRSFTSKIRI